MKTEELQSLFDRGVEKYNEEKEAVYRKTHPQKREYFYISDAGKCKRSLYFDFKPKYKRTNWSIELLRKFQNGEYAHERLVKYLQLNDNLIIESEVTVPLNKYNLHGRADIIIYNLTKAKYGVVSRKPYCVLELKTINMREVKEPIEVHTYQLQFYLYFFNLDFGFLVYESKQTNNLFLFRIEKDLKVINKQLTWFKEMKKNIEFNNIPIMSDDYKSDKYPCNFCNYKQYCWKDGNE